MTTIETAEASAIPEPSPRARALHEASLVWDAHMDSLMRVLAGEDLGVRTEGQADLVRWREGGVDVQVFAVWVDTVYGRHHAARRALQQIDGFHRLLEANPDRVGLARSATDIARLRGEGKLAAVLAIEGGIAIQNDLALLRTFHRLGATSMTLTHSASLDWADSSTDAARCGGLSAFGREVIREMHRLRMLVDVSHVSDDCIRDVLDLSDAPIIASHSSCKAISNHPRNLSDAMLRTIAAAGGVVGINFYSQFLDQAYSDEMGRRSVDLLAMLNAPPPLDPDALDAYADEFIMRLQKVVQDPSAGVRATAAKAMASIACAISDDRVLQIIGWALALLGRANSSAERAGATPSVAAASAPVTCARSVARTVRLTRSASAAAST